MNLLVISDLHIGRNNKFETFGWDTDEFIRRLEKVKRKYHIDKVILNGDIYELYQFSYDEVKKSNVKLVEYLNSKDFIYIRGNHDVICPFGLDSFQITNSKGKTIYIEHGHKVDFLNGTRLGRFIGKIGFQILKRILRFKCLIRLYIRIIEYNDKVYRIPKKYDSYKYLNYSLRLLKMYDVVILGHTHKLEAHKTYYLNNKKRYLNCGSCSLGRFQGVIINTETLKYSTIKKNWGNKSKKEKKKKKPDIIKYSPLTQEKEIAVPI